MESLKSSKIPLRNARKRERRSFQPSGVGKKKSSAMAIPMPPDRGVSSLWKP